MDGGFGLRVRAAVGAAFLLVVAASARAGDEPRPGLASAGKPSAAGARVAIAGRVERDGRGVAARVSAWTLPPMESRALARAQAEEDSTRSGMGYVAEGRDDSWWVSREARTKAVRVLVGNEKGEVEGASAEDGSFRLDAEGGGVDHLLLAQDAEGRAVFSLVRAGAEATATALHLPSRAETVEARLTFRDGTPFRGTTMLVPTGRLFPVEGGVPPRRPAEDGRVRFPLVPEGVYRLRCDDERGTVTLSPRLVVPLVTPVAFVVDEPTRLVRGTVRGAAGAPPADVTVSYAVKSPERDVVARVRADAAGGFSIALPPRAVTLWAESPTSPARSAEVAADATSVEIVLAPFLGLEGRVVDASTGAGVAGVPVYVVEGNGCVGLDVVPFTATSEADGAFSVPSPPRGVVRVFAFGHGVMSEGIEDAVRGGFDPLLVDVGATSRGPLVLRVVPAGRIEGRVVDPDGRPIAGARVSLAQSDPMHGMCGNGYRRHPIFPFLPDPADARTGADGRFEVSPLRPSLLYAIGVSAPGFDPAHWSTVVEERGAERVDVTLHRVKAAGPPRPLAVRVTSAETGEPLPGADVRLDTWPEEPRTATSDERGAVRFDAVPVLAGYLTVSASGRIAEQKSLPTDASQPGTEVSIAVPLRRALVLSGRVLSPDGKPVADATVSVVYEGARFERPNVTTASDGRFLLREVPPGTVKVFAWAQQGDVRLSHQQDAEGGARDVEVRLVVDTSPMPAFPKSGKARFRVVGPDGRPVARGRYSILLDEKRDYDWGYEFTDGEIRIEPADAGTWTLVVFAGEPAGGGPRLGPVETAPFRITSPPADPVVRMPAGETIRGRVLSQDGAPLPGLRVFGFDPRTPPTARRATSARGEAVSAADGSFVLEGLGKGASLIALEVPTSLVSPEPREVAAGSNVELRIAAAARPWITVLGVDGAPVKGAIVAAVSEGETRYLYEDDRTLPRTGPRGRVRLVGLDPARTYTLAVSARVGGGAEREIKRTDWRPADTTVRYASPTTVSGRLRDPKGAPIEDAWVTFEPAGAVPDARPEHAGVRTLADGTFTTAEAPPGAGLLRFGIGQAGPRAEKSVVVPTTDLELVLDPGPTWTITLDAGTADTTRTAMTFRWTPWREDGSPARESPPFPKADFGWKPTLTFRGLLADHRYALYVRAEGAGLVGWIPDLTGAGGARTLKLLPEGSIQGTVVFADPSDAEAGAFVEVEGRGFNQMEFAEEGKFVVKGLPPGRFTVRARPQRGMMTDAERPEGTAEASTGETVEVRIPARPR